MLRELYPNNDIYLLARPFMCEIFARNTSEKLHVIADKRYESGNTHSVFAKAKYLKQYQFAMAILFRGSLSEALLCTFAGIKYILGYRQNGRTPLLSHGLKLNPNHHYIHRYCQLVNDCHGQPFKRYSLPKLSYQTTDMIVKHETHTPVAVYFGGKNKGPRHYPNELALQTLQRLAKQKEVHFYLLGDPSEKEESQQLASQLAADDISATVLTGTTSLSELVDCIAACQLMISIDSGPMHMAVAVNTPCVAIVGFGTSAWSVVAPKNKQFTALISQSCSLNEYEIITAISPQQITQAALELLAPD
ncbi:glycosyltransferase family 9 protein [Pseudoalteromonas sp. JBTF-M23]|uniref:Glycosyltransferase family 9 protein n=2 Tax=Pseudoalteromonas caenipelagi TaxID=2726988 RepID=A0A849VJQ3_9GAMM|nr:glycosyltransferase family 9 protein [Pseudoalteromonas caenipelagi]